MSAQAAAVLYIFIFILGWVGGWIIDLNEGDEVGGGGEMQSRWLLLGVADVSSPNPNLYITHPRVQTRQIVPSAHTDSVGGSSPSCLPPSLLQRSFHQIPAASAAAAAFDQND